MIDGTLTEDQIGGRKVDWLHYQRTIDLPTLHIHHTIHCSMHCNAERVKAIHMVQCKAFLHRRYSIVNCMTVKTMFILRCDSALIPMSVSE